MSQNEKNNPYSAADTAIGFDFQFYYFFYLLLDLVKGEEIGLEVKDDIHLTTKDGKNILIQTKHSVQEKSDGTIINLTERDKDLWKSLSNWIKLCTDETDQKAYITKSEFRLISNKENNKNPFLSKLTDLQQKTIRLTEFKKYLRDLIDNTEDPTITGYMNDVLSFRNLEPFLHKIRFDLGEDNLITRIKEKILTKIYIENKVDDVYSLLHSELRDRNYLTVKKGEQIKYTFDDFKTKFGRCFPIGMSKLVLRRYDTNHMAFPEKPEEQIFIKQLIDIRDVESTDLETMILYTTFMLRLHNNLKDWQTKDGLLIKEINDFEMDSVNRWRNAFKSAYKGALKLKGLNYDTAAVQREMQLAADKLIEELRKFNLSISDTELDSELCNGHFYSLIEQFKIGLLDEWEKKYKA